MRNNIICTLIFCIVFFGLKAQNNKNQKQQHEYSSEQERKELIDGLRMALERARDRIDTLQQNAPLRREVTYEKEEEQLREARQILELLEEGNYVERSVIKDWEKRLNKLASKGPVHAQYDNNNNPSVDSRANNSESTNRWNESIRRSNDVIKRGEEAIRTNRKKIEEARKNLEDQRKANSISEREYQAKLSRIRQAEERVNDLEQRIGQERQKISELNENIAEDRGNN